MTIWILSAGKAIASTRRLAQVLEAALENCTVKVFSPLDLEFSQNQIFFQDKSLALPDGVIPRFGLRTYDQGLSVLQFLEALNVPTLNSSTSIARVHHKLQTQLMLKKIGLAVPEFYFQHFEKESAYKFNFFPAVIKLTVGSQGKGVQILESQQDLNQALDTLRTLEAEFYLERYIEGEELRSIMWGEKVLATIQKTSTSKRKNLGLGAKAKLVEIESKDMAQLQRIQAQTGLNFTAIDWIKTQSANIFIDVNAFPGLQHSLEFFAQPLANSLAEYFRLK